MYIFFDLWQIEIKLFFNLYWIVSKNNLLFIYIFSYISILWIFMIFMFSYVFDRSNKIRNHKFYFLDDWKIANLNRVSIFIPIFSSDHILHFTYFVSLNMPYYEHKHSKFFISSLQWSIFLLYFHLILDNLLNVSWLQNLTNSRKLWLFFVVIDPRDVCFTFKLFLYFIHLKLTYFFGPSNILLYFNQLYYIYFIFSALLYKVVKIYRIFLRNKNF